MKTLLMISIIVEFALLFVWAIKMIGLQWSDFVSNWHLIALLLVVIGYCVMSINLVIFTIYQLLPKRA